ncbi:MAG: flagellar assembly protein FliW [Actinomycetota bacterium]
MTITSFPSVLLDVPDDGIQILDGLPGFPEVRGVHVAPVDDYGIFVRVIDARDERLWFLAVNPFVYFGDYEVAIDDEDQRLLEAAPGDELIVYCLVTVDRSDGSMSANLMAPLVIDVTQRTARQCVLDADLPVRAPLPKQPTEDGPEAASA